MKENVKNFKFCHFTQIPEKVPAWKNNILHTSKSVFPNETETRVKNSVDLSGFNIKVPNLLDKVFEKERMIDQEVSDRFFNKRRYVEELIGEAALQEQLSMNLEQEREKRQQYEAEGLGEEDIAYMRQKEREEFLDSLNKPLSKKEKAKLTKKGKFIGLLTGEADNNKIARSVQKKIAGMEFKDLFNDNKVRQVISEAESKGRQDIDMRNAPERKSKQDADVILMRAEEAEKARLLKEAEKSRLLEEASRGDGFVSSVGAGAPAGSGSGSGGGLASVLASSAPTPSVSVSPKTDADVAELMKTEGVTDKPDIDEVIAKDPLFRGSDGAKFAKNATPEEKERGYDLIKKTQQNSASLRSASGAVVQAQAISNEITRYDVDKDFKNINMLRKYYGFVLEPKPSAGAGGPVAKSARAEGSGKPVAAAVAATSKTGADDPSAPDLTEEEKAQMKAEKEKAKAIERRKKESARRNADIRNAKKNTQRNINKIKEVLKDPKLFRTSLKQSDINNRVRIAEELNDPELNKLAEELKEEFKKLEQFRKNRKN